MTHVPVLIVGGGPVGLTASLLLSRLGIRSLLVERHPGTAIHPKARGINARTMEIFRQQGIEAAVRQAGLPPERTGLIVWAKTLAGEEIERRVPWGRSERSTEVSPVRACLCAQDYLEPVLRRCAEQQAPGELRFSTELTGFTQDGAGVTATLRDVATGAERKGRGALHDRGRRRAEPHARRARRRAWSARRTSTTASTSCSRPTCGHGPRIARPRSTSSRTSGCAAPSSPSTPHDRWGFLVNSLKAQGYAPEDFTPERSAELVRLAAGVPDLPVKVLGVAPWVASAHVAEQYRHGRIFLAGDAAHEMPPTGGFGMNTGVQDVHNLCWKLARCCRAGRPTRCLQTYHDERQPLARTITEQSLANAISMGRLQKTRDHGRAARVPQRAGHDLRRDATRRPPWCPTARAAGRGQSDHRLCRLRAPGRPRAACLAAAPDGERVSTIDLVGQGFVLLAGAKGAAGPRRRGDAGGQRHRGRARHRRQRRLQPADERWRETYGIDDGGAVLVRPDGYVGWRSAGAAADPARALAGAMDAIQG